MSETDSRTETKPRCFSIYFSERHGRMTPDDCSVIDVDVNELTASASGRPSARSISSLTCCSSWTVSKGRPIAGDVWRHVVGDQAPVHNTKTLCRDQRQSKTWFLADVIFRPFLSFSHTRTLLLFQLLLCLPCCLVVSPTRSGSPTTWSSIVRPKDRPSTGVEGSTTQNQRDRAIEGAIENAWTGPLNCVKNWNLLHVPVLKGWW